MDTPTKPQLNFAAHQHKRTTSSVLKSIIAPRSHQRNHVADLQHANSQNKILPLNELMTSNTNVVLPPDHVDPKKQSRAGTDKENLRSPPTMPIEVYEDHRGSPALHKKTKSSVSLKSLIGNEKGTTSKTKSPKKQDSTKPKKSKSSTSLSTLLSRPKSSKDLEIELSSQQKDKENHTPPRTADDIPPPIWAQFATQPIQEFKTSRKVPLNDLHDVKDEITKYTPREYSPSKQRNFHDSQQPTLGHKKDSKPRPKSAFVPSGPSVVSFPDILANLRKSNDVKRGSDSSNQPPQLRSSMDSGKSSCDALQSRWSVPGNSRKDSDDSRNPAFTMGKRGSRVMAAVAALNGKAKQPTNALVKDTIDTPVDVKSIENAFESLLDSRNVPQQTRDKMRALDTSIKADLIKQDKWGCGSASTSNIKSTQTLKEISFQRPFGGPRSKTDDGIIIGIEAPCELNEIENSPKKSRGRSRTSTLSKGDLSPSKKQKHERPLSRGRPNSSDLTPTGSSKSLASVGAAQPLAIFAKTLKPAVPEEFILYLRKVQKPEFVEVGRLRKLRQLLRNETITWVDTFITKGGMTEVVQLLYRIVKVEWREEHEDTLLHETLLCLKALCTATLARQQLADIQTTLFPTLLAMLFDEEKKGPSEFTTRSIVISLMFTYLSDSPPFGYSSRAQTLLSYLRDPSPPEADQPPGFIASMHQPRPYRIWCKEIVNVTKEVFWIFLHHMNVIPYPPDSEDPRHDYKDLYFPRERPPVPAAPYVGGVEWEATNYLASHLDVLNGIIASLPSSHERNSLRQELKVSGFEKCLGGSLRTCKEKFYGAVHAGLTTWIGAAREDGWDVSSVREGPKRDEAVKASPKKKRAGSDEEPPRLEIPQLDLDVGRKDVDDGGWL